MSVDTLPKKQTPIAPSFRLEDIPGMKVGDRVYWYDGGDKNQEPRVAFVTQVNPTRTLELNILEPNQANFRCRSGVRWLHDPRLKADELIDDGGWELMPKE